MKRKVMKIPARAQLPLALGGVLAIGVLGYMTLVGPQRSKAAAVAQQIASTQGQISANLVLKHHVAKPPTIEVADLFKLVKAMPDQEDMPEIILELNRVAGESGISFESISPGLLTVGAGYQTRQIDLQFSGNFYGLSDFLYRLRSLVNVRGGKLDANGRLFAVQSLAFGEGSTNFPQIAAKVTIDAYVYATGSAAAPATPSSTTPAATTTTTPAPSGATAAGATGG